MRWTIARSFDGLLSITHELPIQIKRRCVEKRMLIPGAATYDFKPDRRKIFVRLVGSAALRARRRQRRPVLCAEF
jgi:hypothetical protein